MVEFEREDNKEKSGLLWVFIILVGVFLGNVLSYGMYEIYNYWKLKMIIEAASTALDAQQLKSSEQRKIQERKNIIHQSELKEQKIAHQKKLEQQRIARQREKNKQNSVKSQLQKTCTFWNQQVQKDNTTINRNNRDLACARLSNYR